MIHMKIVLQLTGILITDISDHLPVFYVSSDSETDKTIRSESSSSTYRRITEKKVLQICLILLLKLTGMMCIR